MHLVRKAKDGTLSVIAEPIWELAISADARLLLPGRLGKGTWDLFAIEEARIVCASFQ
jgi:hypothetical protein